MNELLEKLVERVQVLSDVAFGDGHINIEVIDDAHTDPMVVLYDCVWVAPPCEGSPKYAWGTVENDPGSYSRAPETEFRDEGAAAKADDAVKEALALVLGAMVEDHLAGERDAAYEDKYDAALQDCNDCGTCDGCWGANLSAYEEERVFQESIRDEREV